MKKNKISKYEEYWEDILITISAIGGSIFISMSPPALLTTLGPLILGSISGYKIGTLIKQIDKQK